MAEKMPERVSTDTSADGGYSRWRDAMLDPTSIGLVAQGLPAMPLPIVLGILMEFGYAGASASLFADTNASRVSLLFSNGGGVLGGALHEEVCRAVPPLFEAAKRCLAHLTPATSFPVPEMGQVTFYVLTTSGTLTGGGPKDDLAGDRSPLSPLFHAGQEVLTQLRLRAEEGHSAGVSAGDRIGKKVCPHCGKDLNVYAVKCRHCKAEL
jgi:hypothetical protein